MLRYQKSKFFRERNTAQIQTGDVFQNGKDAALHCTVGWLAAFLVAWAASRSRACAATQMFVHPLPPDCARLSNLSIAHHPVIPHHAAVIAQSFASLPNRRPRGAIRSFSPRRSFQIVAFHGKRGAPPPPPSLSS